MSGLKNFGKKDHVTKEEKKEHGEVKPEEVASTSVVSDEAPKLEQPTLAEPIKIEEVRSETHAFWVGTDIQQSTETKPTAPPAAPVVSATA